MSKGAIMTAFSSTGNVTVANTTQERTLSGPGVGSLVLPANYLEPGTSLRILARGVWSTVAQPTLRWRLKLGSGVILDTGPQAGPKDVPLLQQNVVGEPWALEVIVVCRAVGPAGSVLGAGSVASRTAHSDFIPQTEPVAIDTTKALALDVTVAWGTADPGDTITCTHLLIWAEQPI